MEKKPIALQLCSVRDSAEQDFYGTLRQLKAFGYDGVEFAGLFGQTPETVRQVCQELELVPISAHVPWDTLQADPEDTVRRFHAIGCKYLVIPGLPGSMYPGRADFPRLVELLTRLARLLAERGMVLQYHNHDFEFEMLEGKNLLDHLYDQIPPQVLQTQLDTCWVCAGGADPVAYVRKYAGRIPTVHLKDFVGQRTLYPHQQALIPAGETPQEFAFRALGRGVQDISAIVKASIEGGAQWFIVEQDRATEGLTAMESARVSAEHLLNRVFV